MAIEKSETPYEFLARWDEKGALSGAHIQYRQRVIDTDTGEVLSERLSTAMPVSVGVSDGFPLGEILDDVVTASLLAVEEASARAKKAEEAVAAQVLGA